MIKNKHYSYSINRSYYSAFYAIKAVHALSGVSYKSPKDVIDNFNKDYIVTGIVSRSIGSDLASLEREKNSNDYDDFVIAYRSNAEENYNRAKNIVHEACLYCASKGVDLVSVEASYYLNPEQLEKFLNIAPPSLLKVGQVKKLIDSLKYELMEK